MTQTIDARDRGSNKMATVIYGLYAVNLAVPGPFGLIGVILAYLNQDDARGTYMESHYRWQIRTFWLGIAWFLIGLATIPIIIGLVILCLWWLWWAARIAVGWSRLAKEQPMVNPTSWLL